MSGEEKEGLVMRIWINEDEDRPNQFALFEANCQRQIKGRAGQKALRELERALVELPEKRLVAKAIACGNEVCAVGALLVHQRVAKGESREDALARYQSVVQDDDEYCGAYDDFDGYQDPTDEIAAAEGVPALLAWKLVYLNDERCDHCTPEERYEKVLAWVRRQIKSEGP